MKKITVVHVKHEMFRLVPTGAHFWAPIRTELSPQKCSFGDPEVLPSEALGHAGGRAELRASVRVELKVFVALWYSCCILTCHQELLHLHWPCKQQAHAGCYRVLSLLI